MIQNDAKGTQSDAIGPHYYGVVIVDVFSRQSQEICNLLKRKINDVLFPDICNSYLRGFS